LRIPDDWEKKIIIEKHLSRVLGVRVKRVRELERMMAANWESLGSVQIQNADQMDRARFMSAWGEQRVVFGYTLLSELPHALLRALQEYDDLEALNYNLIIVDEYQDLNACELEVLKELNGRGCSIIAGGDDDQSIYSFRCAAPDGIRSFCEDYENVDDYPLHYVHRFGDNVIRWANYVISGDLDRPAQRQELCCVDDAPAGEVSLLSFRGQSSECQGITSLVKSLIEKEGIPPGEILVLLRSDYQEQFSRPIKESLREAGIRVSDPNELTSLLSDENNRELLAFLRLIVNRHDSLAWASLMKLTTGVGDRFFNRVYQRARERGTQYSSELLSFYEEDFPGVSAGPSRAARERIADVIRRLDDVTLPEDPPNDGWGSWILEQAQSGVIPSPTEDLGALLLRLDDLMESDIELGRYLGQANPLAKDLAYSERNGVRVMTMASAKGLTVKASVVAAVEEGVIPRPGFDRREERRLLYVAMTRARHFLYLTWCQRRTGPTARSGRRQVRTLRRYSSFLEGGPVGSQDGEGYIRNRWS